MTNFKQSVYLTGIRDPEKLLKLIPKNPMENNFAPKDIQGMDDLVIKRQLEEAIQNLKNKQEVYQDLEEKKSGSYKSLTIIDLISEEIRKLSPPTRRQTYDEFLKHNEYDLQCSPIFAKYIRETFINIGFNIPIMANGEEVVTNQLIYTKYQSPQFGIINVFSDMEQGYTITKSNYSPI